jgi:polar amino acid transport system substrate-binding protein
LKNTAGSRSWGWLFTFRRSWFWGQLAINIGLVIALLLLLFSAKTSHSSLTIGCDANGGAPYYIKKNGILTGFEVRLGNYLAAKEGTTATYVESSWATLLHLLKRHDCRLVLNGYEWSAKRDREFESTIPYYIYKLQLIVRKDENSIRGWDDLRAKPGQAKKSVSVLQGSMGQRYLEKEFGDDIELVALDATGATSAMELVVNRQLDATVQDNPPATYYLKDKAFAKLEARGDLVSPGYYVIYVRKDDTELRDRLNSHLREALKDGTLERIYKDYDLWNDDQKELATLAYDWPRATGEEDSKEDDEGWQDYALLLVKAAGITMVLSFMSMPAAMLAGLLIALGRLYGPKWLDWLLRAYVELIRGTPLLLQIFVIYFLLPELGINIPGFAAAVIGLAINYSAYEAENYRAGLLAIPRGQMEAALALGMSKGVALRRIIVPQAVLVVVPSVTNDFIALFKDTSVCSMVAGVIELTGQYNQLMINNPSHVVLLGAMTGLLYLLMSYPLALVARRLETQHTPVTQ